MSSAFLTMLKEEGTKDELFNWVHKLYLENERLRQDKRKLDEENAKLRNSLTYVI